MGTIKEHFQTFGDFCIFLEQYEKNPEKNLPEWVYDLELDERYHMPFTSLVEDIEKLGFSYDLRRAQAFKLAQRFYNCIYGRHKYKNLSSWKATKSMG